MLFIKLLSASIKYIIWWRGSLMPYSTRATKLT